MSIGYANKPGKTAELITAGADTVVRTPAALSQQIMAIFDQAPLKPGPV